MPGTVRLVDPDGVERDVAVDSAPTLLQDPRWRIAASEDTLSRLAAQAHEADYGGAGGAVAAGLTGLGRGLTLGGTDVLGRALYGDQAAIDLEGVREAHPGVSFGSEVVGAVLPAAFTGGATLPSSAASAAGRGVARVLGGGLRGAVGGGATEGALFGLGQGVSELALSTDPLTTERAASVLSSNALFGAGAGAAGGLLAKGAELGLAKAKGAIDGALLARSESRAMKAVGELEAAAAAEPAAITAETDVSLLDREGLKTARKQELEAIRTAQAPERDAFVDDLRASRDAAKEEKAWIATQNGKTREVREIGKLTLEADQRIDRLLKNPIELTEQPAKALSALRQQEHALGQMQAWGEREVQRYLDEVAGARNTIRTELLDNKLPGYIVGKGGISKTSPVIDDIVEREFQARYPNPERLPTNLQVLNSVPAALERNKALQDRLAKLAEAPQSERLGRIGAAEEALGVKTAAPKPETAPSLGRELLHAAAPFAGPLGAIASHGTRAFEGLRKAAAAAGERGGKAVSAFLGPAVKAVGKAAPYAPAVATKVLAQLSYAEPEDKRQRMREAPEPKEKLARLFRDRTDEIKGQIQIAPDGSFKMRPAARMKLAAKFDGIRPLDPHGADDLEELAARRLQYLASIIPRRPDIGGLPIGPDRWIPSDSQMRAWTRAAGALEDPHAVFERAAAGRVVPEEAAAIRAVYPGLLGHWLSTVTPQLPTMRHTLPYVRRLSLSILTGIPVDAAMTPSILRVIQGMYASEPGTAGGTRPPVAQPQFGSVKRSDPGTPAQRREGLPI
jgi:hypothetical protein